MDLSSRFLRRGAISSDVDFSDLRAVCARIGGLHCPRPRIDALETVHSMADSRALLYMHVLTASAADEPRNGATVAPLLAQKLVLDAPNGIAGLHALW